MHKHCMSGEDAVMEPGIFELKFLIFLRRNGGGSAEISTYPIHALP
jgi:hypothetical protein